MIDAIPNPPVIVAEAAASHQPYVFLGFVASGSETSSACIERNKDDPALKIGRTEGPNNVPEVMVLFTPGGTRESQLQAYRSARSGACSGAKIEIVVVPVDALKRGGGGLEKATIEEPSFIIEPKS